MAVRSGLRRAGLSAFPPSPVGMHRVWPGESAGEKEYYWFLPQVIGKGMT